MTTTYATLELGDTTDALAWQKGCESLGRMSAISLLTQWPTHAQLKEFFTTEPEWVYFSGHISGTRLYGHLDNSAELMFREDGIALPSGAISVKYDPTPILLLKKRSEFTMQKSCSLIIFAGCSALGSLWTMQVIRKLFFNPTILGYAEGTDLATNVAMMGVGPDLFFANYRGGLDLVNAWLQSGLSVEPSRQSKFSAFDTDGQEWKLVDSKVVKGRRA